MGTGSVVKGGTAAEAAAGSTARAADGAAARDAEPAKDAVRADSAARAEGAAPTAPCRGTSRPRADALRNRERIIAAARELFVEFGPDVALDDVARRAGVGNATLYRNFPDRAALTHEVVLAVTSRTTLRAEEAEAAEADPFAALSRFVHAAADERIGALCPMLSGVFDRDHPDLLAERGRLEEAVEGLVARAQSAGRLRTDIAVGDVLVALSQLTRPLPGIACQGIDRFTHRHLQLFLDGLETPARSELPGSAATLEDLRRS
ncbi:MULTISPECIES: TetR/AcrR family transcriptional regulator [unclassified Streptomyces]|uniref:TetR/AcrR family transcriptional regulator n=1 Tax=unclassified Streptomyces TaxID=2593676 RepID=UPI001F305D21|nr:MULTISPECIES: TetR/AcrR family transcriptional regulator [unclassified Streptomyces]